MSNSNRKNPKTEKTSPIWGGRFSKAPSQVMQEINASISYDHIIYKQDIQGSIAHATMLGEAHILADDDVSRIIAGLSEIEQDIREGKFEFKATLEDIHMNIEAALALKIGEPAKRLHTARSRNDQVATDLRLWIREAIDQIDQQIQATQAILISQAETHCQTVMPGYTHLQTAQPITLGFHLMAYVEMLGRDRGRFTDCRKRLNESPLGAAALAGTSHPINRHRTAELLGFDKPISNAMDSVSARDFVVEFIGSIAICSTHLSRLAEEIVIWSTDRFKFISLSDGFTTGSSIMPQKRNPDAAELVRAKSGRIIGDLVTMLTVLKGLPLAYSKDMQEDKEPVFDATKSLSLSLAAMAGMLADMSVHKDNMRAALCAGHPTATDLADYLVASKDIAFRDAHHLTGQLVALADKQNCGLDQLSLHDIQSIIPELDDSVFEILSIDRAIEARTSFGGTAVSEVVAHIQSAKRAYLD